jgi:hypothetical protein
VSNYLGGVWRVHTQPYVETVTIVISQLEVEARGTAHTKLPQLLDSNLC